MIVISKAEKILAEALRKRNMEYAQQIEIGPYTVDFFLRPKLIVEVEGPFHISSERSESDIKRHKFLEGIGYVVLRISDRSVRANPRENADFIVKAYKNPEKFRTYQKEIEAFPELIDL
jgi:very-short-patch-repair endonuclease